MLSSVDAINDNTRLTIKAESVERSIPKEQPGFEVYPAVTSILFVIFLFGKRKKLGTLPEDSEL